MEDCVLVVEDSQIQREVIASDIAGMGFVVDTACDGTTALDMIKEKDYSLVTSDIVMPGIDGLSLLRSIKDLDEDKPVVIITANKNVNYVLTALRNGAFDFIDKPYNRELLKFCIERALRFGEIRRQNSEAKRQLNQSGKLAAIGQLAAGVAHEINNPIGFILSNMETLREYATDITGFWEGYGTLAEEAARCGPGNVCPLAGGVEALKKRLQMDFLIEDITKLVDESREGAQRVKKIVMDLKDFAHKDDGILRPVDINQCMDTTLNIAWNEIKYKATVVKEYGDIPEFDGYPAELNQVFMNLLVNAAQAIKEKGTITVRTFAREGSAVAEVSDTGCGIPKDVADKIFEPFFTTKGVGEGTGLGLSTAYGIVKKHNGKIEVESGPGKGSTFRVLIPLGG